MVGLPKEFPNAGAHPGADLSDPIWHFFPPPWRWPEILDPRGYTWAFWRACLINVLCCSGAAAFLLFPKYLARQGMPEDGIGLVEASFWLASMAVQPWLGRRLDVLGRRRFFIAGSFLMAAVSFAYLAVPVQLATMVPLRAIQGLAVATYLTALTAWVTDQAPPGRLAEFLGIFGVTGLLGATLGPLSAEKLFKHVGDPGLFLGSGTVCLLGALWSPSLRDRFTKVASRGTVPGYWEMAGSRNMRGTLLGSVAFGVATGSVVSFVAPFLDERHLEGVGILLAVYALASGGTRIYAATLADRLGPSRVVGPSLALQAGAILLISFLAPEGWRAMPMLLLAAFLGGTGHGMVYPALSALAVHRLGSRFAGTGMSMVAASADLGSSLGAFIAGYLVRFLGYPAMFISMSLLVALAGLVFRFVEERSASPGKTHPPEPPACPPTPVPGLEVLPAPDQQGQVADSLGGQSCGLTVSVAPGQKAANLEGTERAGAEGFKGLP